MEGRRNPFVAREGIPFLLVVGGACLLALRSSEFVLAIACALLFIVLYQLFRDPRRLVPSAPLGVVSPVDGTVIAVEKVQEGVLQGEAHRIRIAINSFGTYTARAPVEGKIMDLRSAAAEVAADYETNALWLRTDEDDDVVLQFTGYRLGLAPRAIIRYGERTGQGQRCAYLRLTRFAEVHLPISSTVVVEPGSVVVAGSEIIGKLLHS